MKTLKNISAILVTIFFCFIFNMSSTKAYSVCVYKYMAPKLNGSIVDMWYYNYAAVHVENGKVIATYRVYDKGLTSNIIDTILSGHSLLENKQVGNTLTVTTDINPSELEGGCKYSCFEPQAFLGAIFGYSSMTSFKLSNNILCGFGLDGTYSDPNDVKDAISYSGGVDSGTLIYKSTLFTGNCYSEIKALKLLNIAYIYLKILTPIALLLFGSIDIAKAVVANDESKIKKAQAAFLKRLIAAIIVFLSFTILEFIIKLAPDTGNGISCLRSLFGVK